jgi:hypothetical protein
VRRKAAATVEPPAELRTYTPPDTSTDAEMWVDFRQWCDRRFAYGQENGWPGGMLVLLRQNVGIGDRLHGRPPRW